MSSLKNRLLNGAGAYGYGQAVKIGTQLTGVPIFLSFWNMETYGIWTMLCAFPVYIAIADFGIATVAGNKMTMLYADNKHAEANIVFQSALLMCSLIAIGLFIISVVCAYVYQTFADDRFVYMNSLLLLIFAALLALMGSLFDSLFRSVGQYAKGTVLVTTTLLMEWVFSIIGVFLFGTIEAAAIGFLLGRVLMTLFTWLSAVRTVQVYQWSIRQSSMQTVRELLRPSLAFMAFPLGNAINLQGITMLIGFVLGPAAVVIYNTYRTVSRILVQAVSLVTKPVWPELSAAFGAKDSVKADHLVRLMALYAFGVTLLGALLLYLFGNLLIDFWTKGQVHLDSGVYSYVLAAAAVSAFSQVFITLIVSTNNHIAYCKFFIFSSVFNFVGIYLFREQLGLFDIAALMFVIECVLFAAAYWFAKKVKIGVVSV